MQSNRNVKGLPVISEQERIRQRSLKVYIYLVCISQMVDNPFNGGSPRRVFQQKDVNLSKMAKVLKMDERTIKKYWEALEADRLVIFNAKGSRWEEDDSKTFVERWKERRKHGETYYHIDTSGGWLFRKLPRETLIELNTEYQASELTIKIYLTLVNLQEKCIINNQKEVIFTYQDLQKILGYSSEDSTNRKMEKSLLQLQSLGLIQIKVGERTVNNGWKIPVFILKQVNWYIDYEFKGLDTTQGVLDAQLIEETKKEIEQYIISYRERGA